MKHVIYVQGIFSVNYMVIEIIKAKDLCDVISLLENSLIDFAASPQPRFFRWFCLAYNSQLIKERSSIVTLFP